MKLLVSILSLAASQTCTCPEGSTIGVITTDSPTIDTTTTQSTSSECPNRSTVTRKGIQCQAWNTNEPHQPNSDYLPDDADTGKSEPRKYIF